MSGSPVKIGPFTGGINTYSEPVAIGDTEAVELLNFDIDLDGSVLNRPPVGVMPSSGGNGCTILGMYTTAAFVTYVIMVDESNVIKAFSLTGGAAAYTITSGVQTETVVQYQNKLWIVATPSSANPGGKWDPVGGFVAVSAIARGNNAVVYKERLFISSGPQSSNPNRINFSAPANLESWTPGTDFFDVAQGDGQYLVKIYSYQGYIVCFKNGSTYTFGYDTQPTKGQVQLVAATIGIASSDAFEEVEGTMYCIHGNFLYAIANWNWSQINIKVPFTFSSFSVKTTNNDFSLSVVGNRLVARYYDTFYVYGTKTRAFSTWTFSKTTKTPHKFWRYPVFDTTTNLPIYVSGNYNVSVGDWFKLIDTPESTFAEAFDLSVITKTYDYNVPYNFKRLFYWGVDILAKTDISFLVRPTVYNTPIKWGDISNVVIKWGDLKSWARPIDLVIDVTDSATTSNPSGIRTFIKLLKSLRFRQISFQVSSTVDGTSVTTPFRLFSVIAFTSSKQLVSRKIS